MTEKINQLCDQIKDLLQKNDREYIIGKIPYDIEESPEFYKSIFDTIGDEIGDFADDILCLEMDLDLQYSIHEDYGTGEGQTLNAIRIKSDELVFFIEEIYNVGDGPETGCLYEESIDDLMTYNLDKVVDTLEYYVVILSDKTEYAPCWAV